MNRIARLSKWASLIFVLTSVSIVLGASFKSLEVSVESTKTIPGKFTPRNIFEVSIKNDRVAIISTSSLKKSLIVFNSNGDIVFSAECNDRATYCELIDEGTRVFIRCLLTEKQYLSEVYDISKQSKILSFESKFPIKPSPSGGYFYTIYDLAIQPRQDIFNENGEFIGSIKSQYGVWEATALNDNELIMLDGNILKIISIPDLTVTRERKFEELSKPALQMGLSIDPDGDFCCAYNSENIVIYDISSDIWNCIEASHPGLYGSEENIFISNSGKYITSNTWIRNSNIPHYSLFFKTDSGYKNIARFKELPISRSVSIPNNPGSYFDGTTISLYYTYYPRTGVYFSSAIIKLPEKSDSAFYTYGTSGVLLPSNDGRLINFQFGDSLTSSLTIEILNVLSAE